jgi:apoptosis-inducing factor 3
MAEETKRDLTEGFLVRDLSDGAMAPGPVDGEDVVVVRRGDGFFAVGASCTHYHAMEARIPLDVLPLNRAV